METTNTLLQMVNGVDLSDVKAGIMAAGAAMLAVTLAIMGVRTVTRMFKH